MNPVPEAFRIVDGVPVATSDMAAGSVLLDLSGRTGGLASGTALQVGDGAYLEPDHPAWKSFPHGCVANCIVDFRTRSLVCRHPVEAGTPLAFNRLTTLWEHPAVSCHCGSPRCAGKLAGFAALPEELQEEIAPDCSPFVLLQRFLHAPPDKPSMVVLTPYMEGASGLFGESYDDPAFKAEAHRWGRQLGLPCLWVPVSFGGLPEVVSTLARVRNPLAWRCLNLCDGNELDGYPGISVVRELSRLPIPYTGAGPDFFAITSDKIAMKRRFQRHGVPTARWTALSDTIPTDDRVAREVGFPAIVKPSVSAGSYGISIRSVVHSDEEAARCVADLLADPLWGEAHRQGGVFAERFVEGREFTVFLVGTHVYPAVERVFHSKLPALERLLSYDRYWGTYESESPLPPEEPFYRYARVEPGLSAELEALALRSFQALDGNGYARVDIRRCDRSGELAVLEVNANCGLSENETSVAGMARMSGIPFLGIVAEILEQARTGDG